MLLFQKDSSVNEGYLKKASSFYLFNQIFSICLSFTGQVGVNQQWVACNQPTM